MNSNEVLQGNFARSRGFSSSHNGIDLMCPKGTPVIARFNGKLVRNGTNPVNQDFGNYCLVEYEINVQGWYAHLDRFARGLGIVI